MGSKKFKAKAEPVKAKKEKRKEKTPASQFFP